MLSSTVCFRRLHRQQIHSIFKKLQNAKPNPGLRTTPGLRSIVNCPPHARDNAHNVDVSRASTSSAHRSFSLKSQPNERRTLLVTAAELDADSRQVRVTCDDGERYSFPYVWLRDNCQCEECFNQHTLSRSFLMHDLDVDVKAKSVTVDDQNNAITVTWDNGHQSTYTADWLQERSFTESAQNIRKTWYTVPPKSWDSDLQLPTLSYEKILSDDRALYDWLHHIAETGLVLVTGTPCETNSIYEFSKRIAFLRKTNYGETWRIRGDPGTTNIAYTTQRLGLHNDLPYYKNQPGVQLMLCLQQCATEGGENIFADGCHLTQQLRDKHPEYYDLLTTTPLDYTYEEDDYYKFLKILQVPLLSVDEHGRLTRVSYNQHKRDSFFNIPLEKVEPYYRAFKHFDNMLFEPHNTFRMKLNDGDMICFDNLRLLHGREAYTVSGQDVRHLEGGYIDWDEVYSRLRVLRKSLKIDS